MNKEMKEYLYNKLSELIVSIAYDNKDFFCSKCLTTIDELLSIVNCLLGWETYCELRDMVDEIMKDEEE